MVRATIVVGSVAELWDAYSWFKETGIFEIISLKEKLTLDLKNITIVFDFDRKIIGELQFRYEPVPPQYYANHVLYELERSNSHLEFVQGLLKWAKGEADRGRLSWQTGGELASS